MDTLRMEYFFVKEKEGGDMRMETAFMKMDTLCFSVRKKTEAGLYYLRYVPRKIEGLDQNTHW
ncbi:MAG: hypothetical protein OIF50_04250 [Flavobacteriaceae bacterium]|nr:hypothetical protein [Flavobacteriaceae bacterium]